MDNDGNNALFHALRYTDVLSILVNTKIDVNNINKNYDTVGLYCCKNDIYTPLKSLTMNLNLNVNVKEMMNVKTPAMYLAEKGKYSEMVLLNRRNCSFDYVK